MRETHVATALRATPAGLGLARGRRCSSTQAYGLDGTVSSDPDASIVTPNLVDRLRLAVRDPAGAPLAPDGLRPAAVLLLCDPAAPGVPLLFVLRSEELRNHPGQIAFPGGGAETADADVVATALREAGEELGIGAESVEILGALTTFSTVVSGRWLTPVVGPAAGADRAQVRRLRDR